MSRLRLNRSATRALLLFWPFQSLPRCWYFASSDLPESAGPLAHVALPLLLGLLRDGLFVAALLLPIQVLHLLGARRRIPSGLTECLGVILTFALSLLLVCALADVEFMRYLGFHATLTHLALVVDWEKFQSSLSHELTPLAFPSLLLAAGFILSSALVRLDGALRFLRTGRGALASAAALALGTAAAWVPVPGPVTANAAENFFVSVVWRALRSDDLGLFWRRRRCRIPPSRRRSGGTSTPTFPWSRPPITTSAGSACSATATAPATQTATDIPCARTATISSRGSTRMRGTCRGTASTRTARASMRIRPT
jgi:hypothetical protein